ncbi:phage terminase small subunit [Bifidobacterium eulemuris]|uniref:Phage protein n=1 Tax=Bifidobacterium eulemuris TaxID=1765219 RepID=A0A261GA10_9BIFI|nr:hypothetical protein [Bifidobacterium eulemuris]OZG68267.1 hypothetical protein BEUL_1280 [Bifidobacterium eulemuris]QOL31677.1 hypothetical protein BE0216_03775 [Bifidobacterium eulemuris]
MAGNGRKSKKGAIPVLRSDGEKRGPNLPSTRPDGEEWLERTVKEYEAWRTSPQAQRMGTEPDWYALQDLMFIKDLFYRRPSAILASEIRMREALFGGSPAARQALKFDAPQPDDMAASTGLSDTQGARNERVNHVRAAALGLRVVNGGG